MRVRVYTDDFLLLTPAQPPFLPAGLHLFHEAGRGDIVLLRQRGTYSWVRCAPRETAMGKQGATRRKTVLKARV